MRYAIKRIKMEENEAVEILNRVRARLADRALPRQEVIAEAIEVDQPFISRAKRGSLKRVTPRVRRLDAYLSRHAALCANAGERAEAGDRDGVPRRRRSALKGVKPKREVRDTKLAKRSCEAYLADGYNARVLINQIDLLRRAQSKSR
jgi:hypothetical protein